MSRSPVPAFPVATAAFQGVTLAFFAGCAACSCASCASWEVVPG
ncbi:hypothetical protein [Corallococcus sp. 4LFB]